MDVLDVGQGLGVVVRTHDHNLIYDSGPRYSSENDGGSRIILPTLRAMGITHVDGLIISHGDTDHSGGGLSLQKGVAIDWLLSSLGPTHPIVMQAKQSITCYAGQAWQWEGVDFEIIHPLRENTLDETRKTNDRGCVLRISAQGKHLLLPADIEAVSEREILQRSPQSLTADVLIAPHHGSKTSSTYEFIEAVAPQWTIFTVGYRNHFGHPKDEIVQRYVEHRSERMRTDESGAVAIQIEQQTITLCAISRRVIRGIPRSCEPILMLSPPSHALVVAIPITRSGPLPALHAAKFLVGQDRGYAAIRAKNNDHLNGAATLAIAVIARARSAGKRLHTHPSNIARISSAQMAFGTRHTAWADCRPSGQPVN
jgi:beta-lactamase superfamily II metal-dependent hydrolase